MVEPNGSENTSGSRAFVQTASTVLPELDRWSQITEEEAGIATEMIRRNELSGGTPVVRAFEQRWREWAGLRYALTVMNGTGALYSAFFGIGVGPGDEVICPVNTWIGTIAPAVFLGARPVFCDVDPETLLMDPADFEAKISGHTACVVPVHLWGNVCDLNPILFIARQNHIPVLEDCSHAHGAKYSGRICGSLGAAGVWSLQGSKAVSAGEGGVLATDDVEIFERACLCGQVNRMKGVDLVTSRYERYQPLGLGMKFRAHPLGIGIASVQFAKLEMLNARRKAYLEAVEAGLADIPGLRPVKTYPNTERGGFYGFPVIHEPEAMGGVSTEALVSALQEAGLVVGCKPYALLHELPLFAEGFDLFTRNRGPLCPSKGYKGYKRGDFPGAELAAERTIFLPRLSDPASEAAEVVLDTIRKTVERLI